MLAGELIEEALAFFVDAAGQGLTFNGRCPEEILYDFFSERDYLPDEWGDYGLDFRNHVRALAATEDPVCQYSAGFSGLPTGEGLGPSHQKGSD